MTLAEKLSLLAGTGFDTLAIARLNISSLHMTDGPASLRTGPATSFPAGVALAASFDPDLTSRGQPESGMPHLMRVHKRA